MDDRVDVVAELADELAVGVVVEVADETGRRCGVVKEFLDGGAVNGDAHPPSVVFSFLKIFEIIKNARKSRVLLREPEHATMRPCPEADHRATPMPQRSGS